MISEAAEALERQWVTHGHVPQKIRIETGIAVAEILANTVEHGSAGRHLVQIEMKISVQARQIEIVIVDDGNPCDVVVAAARMPDYFAEQGRGLAIAHSALASLIYQREGSDNRWVLTSRRF